MLKPTLSLIFIALTSSAAANDFKSLGPYTIGANESNDRVIQMKVPNKSTVSVAFKGCDIAIDEEENATGVGAKVMNKGRTVMIYADFKDEKEKVHPVHILTKEGRTHTIALVNQGTKYKLSDVQLKVVIDAGKNACTQS